jgi:hypothetical protein
VAVSAPARPPRASNYLNRDDFAISKLGSY